MRTYTFYMDELLHSNRKAQASPFGCVATGALDLHYDPANAFVLGLPGRGSLATQLVQNLEELINTTTDTEVNFLCRDQCSSMPMCLLGAFQGLEKDLSESMYRIRRINCLAR